VPTRTHAHTHTRTHTRTCADSHTLASTHTHTHKHAHSCTRTHTRSRTHAHTLTGVWPTGPHVNSSGRRTPAATRSAPSPSAAKVGGGLRLRGPACPPHPRLAQALALLMLRLFPQKRLGFQWERRGHGGDGAWGGEAGPPLRRRRHAGVGPSLREAPHRPYLPAHVPHSGATHGEMRGVERGCVDGGGPSGSKPTVGSAVHPAPPTHHPTISEGNTSSSPDHPVAPRSASAPAPRVACGEERGFSLL